MTTSALRRRTIDSPIGRLILIADGDGLRRILFANEDLTSKGLRDEDAPEVEGVDELLDATVTQLVEYFAGDRTDFDLPLQLEGTDFQKEAWLALAGIPYGQTISYGRQAERIGRPGAFRAVGSANGQNPVPIVLPCHRVVGADGSLTGFGGGLGIKQQLLDLERDQQTLPL
ncbi:MAG: methylated-DNA--[protein]-cysteine S-methyltransferase [Actinomycetia bacterium]|nr:methylated-DNA--[protein]-cysteine S-methyltransferase [Actinomycetes bacterium]